MIAKQAGGISVSVKAKQKLIVHAIWMSLPFLVVHASDGVFAALNKLLCTAVSSWHTIGHHIHYLFQCAADNYHKIIQRPLAAVELYCVHEIIYFSPCYLQKLTGPVLDV